MILKFGLRILKREWAKLLLPLLSMFITGLVVSTSFFLTQSAGGFIVDKNREFIGGDIVFESNNDFKEDEFLSKVKGQKYSKQITFSGLVESGGDTLSVGFKIVDSHFPLYGNLLIADGVYQFPKENEIYIDQSVAESLKLSKGDYLKFNNAEFLISGIVVADPENIVSSFSFTGRVYLATESIAYANIDLSLFRKEYLLKVVTSEKLKGEELRALQEFGQKNQVRTRQDGAAQGGLFFGLETVERFLTITILIISLLSLVNIYAAINYLANRLRRSFAILVSMGLRFNKIFQVLFFITASIVSVGALVGVIAGTVLTIYIDKYVNDTIAINLNFSINYPVLGAMFFGLFITSIFATFPIMNRMRQLSPRELLSASGEKSENIISLGLFTDILIGLFPITAFAIYFLDSFFYGFLAVLCIVIFYGLVMIMYSLAIALLYRYRGKFFFSLRMMISQKKFDGFFGKIIFSSLFLALISIYTLSILRNSIGDFLDNNVSQSVPSLYVLDVQSSQIDDLKTAFTGPDDISLFPNIRARIKEINGIDVQVAVEGGTIERELGREFNLTYRSYLLPSEKLSKGIFDMEAGAQVSVDEGFAKRINVDIGSRIVFNIQGFDLAVEVTSLRRSDTRSGLPFFYFIVPEKELAVFPKTFFGYSNNSEIGEELNSYLSQNAPNVSVIDTKMVTDLARSLIDILLIIILTITIPPIILSGLLIITILIATSPSRKRDGARLMALGKTNSFIRNYFISESLSSTVLASAAAYISALLIANSITINYLELENIILFDLISFYIFISICVTIIIVSTLIWLRGRKSLKDYLNYEENN